jgi:hypothetical protein
MSTPGENSKAFNSVRNRGMDDESRRTIFRVKELEAELAELNRYKAEKCRLYEAAGLPPKACLGELLMALAERDKLKDIMRRLMAWVNSKEIEGVMLIAQFHGFGLDPNNQACRDGWQACREAKEAIKP